MHTVYASGQYNFLYAALVYDVNTYADDRLNDFSLYWLPSCYFDGGYRYHDGMTTSAITTRLAQCGARVVPDLDLEVTLTWLGPASLQVDVSVTNNQYVNNSPLTPAVPTGPANGSATAPYDFTTSATDPDNDPLYYMFNWGDGQLSAWLGPVASGADCIGTHAWANPGNFNVMAKAKDTMGAETGYSSIASIHLGVPGDANNDTQVNVGDAVYIIGYVFRGGPAPPILPTADANCDGNINVGDAVFIISYVFRGGPEPGCN